MLPVHHFPNKKVSPSNILSNIFHLIPGSGEFISTMLTSNTFIQKVNNTIEVVKEKQQF